MSTLKIGLFSEYNKKLFSAIPLIKKVPIIKEWQKFNTDLPSSDEAKLWDEKFPNHNIGICTGIASGIVAIDIDTDDEETLSIIPDSTVKRKGQKGEVRFYRYNPLISSQKRHDLKIEIFSDSGQVVIPPSIHPITSLPYEWLTQLSLLDLSTDRRELPELRDLSFIEKIPVKLKQIESTFEGRNNALVKTITAMYLQDNKTPNEIIEDIIIYDKETHKIPLFSDPTEHYFRKTKSVKDAAKLMVESVLKTIKDKQKDLIDSNFISQQAPIVVEDIIIEMDLPKAHGILQELIDTILESSFVPQPSFAYASSLSILSTLMCGNYRFEKVNPVLYNMIIGKTGSGKNHPLNFVTNTLGSQLIIQYDFLGSPHQSMQSLIENIANKRVRIDVYDEFSQVLKSYSKQFGATTGLINEYTTLWSANQNMYLVPRSLRKPEATNIYNPCVNMITAIQPETFISNTTRELITSGFLSRFNFFYSSSKKEPRLKVKEIDYENLSQKLIDSCGGYYKKRIAVEVYTDNKRPIALTPLNPFELTIDKAFKQSYRELSVYYYHKVHSTPDNVKKALYSRFYEQIKRIAIISCVSRGNAVVDAIDIDFSKNLLETLMYNSELVVKSATVEGEFGKLSLAVFESIREFGTKGLTKRTLKKIYIGLSNKTMNDVINNLHESGMISIFKKDTDDTSYNHVYIANKLD